MSIDDHSFFNRDFSSESEGAKPKIDPDNLEDIDRFRYDHDEGKVHHAIGVNDDQDKAMRDIVWKCLHHGKTISESIEKLQTDYGSMTEAEQFLAGMRFGQLLSAGVVHKALHESGMDEDTIKRILSQMSS